MRILHSIRSVNPEAGGPIEGVNQVSKIHREGDHVVEIVSLDSPDDPWVKEAPFPTHALGPVAGKFGFTRAFVPWMRRQMHEYDNIIVNGIWQYNSLGIWQALRRSSKPYYVFPHGMLDPWFKQAHPLKHLKKWLYWPWAEYRVLRDACGVCFTCEEERWLARKSFWLYRCAERVVNYGTAAPAEDGGRQRELFFERFPQLRGKRIVLFMGRLHQKKGCDLLIKAFYRYMCHQPAGRSESGGVYLVMAGPDQVNWLPKLQALAASLGIADRVTWPGMLTGDLKMGALWAAEIFALPSHQENFGIAVVEAMACGVPVLISNKVNIWREIEQDQAGLVENDDETGAFNLLRRWFSLSTDVQQKYREHARRCFANRFEIRQAARSLIALLEQGKELDGHRV